MACTKAQLEACRRYRERHREERRARDRERKAADPEKTKRQRHESYLRNREKRIAEAKQYRDEHLEERKTYMREYQAVYRLEHPEEESARCKQWQEANAKKMREYRRKWALSEAGRESSKGAVHRYRAAKAGLPANLTNEDWKRVMEHFGHRCAYCGVENTELVQEHVVPVSAGGGYVAGNIVPACRGCNISKGSRALEDWATRRRGILPGAVARVRNWLNAVGSDGTAIRSVRDGRR
jgi:5-methylcytosine-specific restriction endonuclease McrA